MGDYIYVVYYCSVSVPKPLSYHLRIWASHRGTHHTTVCWTTVSYILVGTAKWVLAKLNRSAVGRVAIVGTELLGERLWVESP
jgi:hypothetical protein